MIRQTLIDAAVPTSQQIFDLILHAENHKKIVWTAGRVLREAALWKRVEEVDYDERKIVLKGHGHCGEFRFAGELAAS